jgi:pimeloyl-ACP methyl ester carboxylesterase
MLRFGPDHGPVVVLAMPLFEEANRTRSLAAALLRLLAEEGIGSALPDLPGVGESEKSIEDSSLSIWHESFSCAFEVAASGRPGHVAALRGGCLVTGGAAAQSRWLMAPVGGEAIVRDLVRARQAADRETGTAFDADSIDQDGPPIELAGHVLPRLLLRSLRTAEPDAAAPCRVVRLDGDPRPADLYVAGAPLWRRSEPGDDPALAATLAVDLAQWVRQCAG